MLASVSWINSQVVFDGLIQGLAIALIAVGIVLVYRATRVINFAVGNIGVVGAAVLSLIAVQYGVPFWAALLVALLIGLTFGALVDMSVIRRLRNAPRVVVLVATIGIGQVAQAIAIKIPTPTNGAIHFPSAWNGVWTVGGVTIHGSDVTILVFVPVTVVALVWFLDHTTIGKTVTACASNPQLARLSSISPKLVSTMVWALAAGLSTLSIVLIAGKSSTSAGISTLGPETLAQALVVAVIAGMTSFRRALVAGVAVGVVQSVLTFNFVDEPGAPYLFLLGTVLVAVLLYRDRESENRVFAFSPRGRPIPAGLRSYWWARNVDKSGLLLLAVLGILLPIVITKPSTQQLWTTVLAFAICASSLTVLTGWLGQLSLGQMAIAGLAALFAARLTADGVPFWVSIAAAAFASAALAMVIGLGSLRVRGLYLAVVTFVFGLAAQQYFYFLPFFSGESTDGQNVTFQRGRLWFISFSGERTYYYVVLACLALVVLVLCWFRKSGVGRTIKAVRDNEGAASAYTVAPLKVKVKAFTLAGGLAGLGGSLLAGAFQNIAFTQSLFLVNDSLALVSMVVIGGMGSITGAVIGAAWVIGIPALAPNNQVLSLLSSSLGLLIILMYFTRGLNQLSFGVRDGFLAWADRRFGKAETPERRSYAATTRAAAPDTGASAAPALAARGLSVRFGGNQALTDASLTVAKGEIVGLIGANGAGKSTLMNAVGGHVRSTGSVQLFGEELGTKAPAARAALGLGRTFQSASLFPELTVTDTLLVAMEVETRSGMTSTALHLPAARRRERAAQAEVGELIHFLGLGPYRDHYISDLSTGTRRVVELAALLALRARVMCLDEPTAGLAQRETEAFGPLILAVYRELAASVLLIEHDMPLIMAMSDRVYCLEAGIVIVEGTPSVVREDPRVIASYLGTDERAIKRSGETDPSAGARGPLGPPSEPGLSNTPRSLRLG